MAAPHEQELLVPSPDVYLGNRRQTLARGRAQLAWVQFVSVTAAYGTATPRVTGNPGHFAVPARSYQQLRNAFLLDKGSYTTFDVTGSTYTYAYGINDAGQIVVNSDFGAFLLDKGFTRLDVPGSDWTVAAVTPASSSRTAGPCHAPPSS